MKPLNIVLVEPEIPQNTGNVARTCACTGSVLHLVEPMGFRLTQRNLQRAGCDYWDDVEIVQWPCADALFEAHGEDELHLFTGHVSRNFTDVAYGEGAFLLFGRESRGLDEAFIQRYLDACVRIPMRENERSLNLSNAVAIATYEALRQQSWPNMSSVFINLRPPLRGEGSSVCVLRNRLDSPRRNMAVRTDSRS